MTQSLNSAKGLLILEEDDFDLVESNNVVHLTLNNTNSKYSIVLFYTDDCDQCKIIKPIVMQFLNRFPVQICMVNVYDPDSTNLIQLSQKTSTPLQHVPFIVFYINGIPFKKFDGNYTFNNFDTFLKNVLTEATKIVDTSTITDIPPYTIGKPKTAKVCYLTYQKAY